MAVFKCKMCGGNLEFLSSSGVTTCPYCGTTQTIPKENDEATQNLFNRANDLRIKCEFDRAEQTYEKILDLNNDDAEAHWGITLCRFGIEYVTDPETKKKIPTCHRASFEPFFSDPDYLSAIELANPEQKSIYVQEAKQIAAIQENILRIAKNEAPFDVFLCYKETDENGNRTADSVIANDIYYQLTQEGYKVFYAPITLEDKLGQEYEPYIFAALNSAKVMLVIGTKPEYFDAVWVKNEWSRFLNLLKKDRSKLLIPCYRDMDPYNLPDRFSHLQAQDMSKIGFINDVVRGIHKVIVKNDPPAQSASQAVQTENEFAPKKKTKNRTKKPHTVTTFTLTQWIVFLIATIGTLILYTVEFFSCVGSFELISAVPLYVIGCLIPILTLSIILLIRKKKNILLALLALFYLFGYLNQDLNLITIILLSVSFLSFFLISLPYVAPSSGYRFKWVRFLFWLPPLFCLATFLIATFLTGNDVSIFNILLFGLLAFSAAPPLKKDVVYPEASKKLKKTGVRNCILLTILCIAFAVAFPLLQNLVYNLSCLQRANKLWNTDPEIAMYHYEEGNLLSADELLEKKYIFACNHPDNYDSKRYMTELAELNYRDAKERLEEMVKWRVEEIAFCNTDPSSPYENLGYVPKTSNYLHVGFVLRGGKPGETIDVYHVTKWPDEGAAKPSWNWENRSDGDYLSFEYSDGYQCDSAGNLEVRFFMVGTGEPLGTITIPVR